MRTSSESAGVRVVHRLGSIVLPSAIALSAVLAAPASAQDDPAPDARPESEASSAASAASEDPAAGPTLEVLPPGEGEFIPPAGPPLGEGEWVDVTPSSQDYPDARSGAATRGASDPSPARTRASGTSLMLTWALLGVALVLLVLAIWRRWKARDQQDVAGDADIARGTLREMSEAFGGKAASRSTPDPATTEPTAEPVGEAAAAPMTREGSDLGPARLALSLHVDKATRSVRMFTLEFTLTIVNRSDRAIRGLTLAGQLTSAQRGVANAPSLALNRPIATIERIGPHQSHTLAGQLQLAMAEINVLKQRTMPVFIPLLHATLDGAEHPASTTSFVIGTPSTASQTRLHPIVLDGPPGPVDGLRANPIKPLATEHAA
jgi:hypothetical protein